MRLLSAVLLGASAAQGFLLPLGQLRGKQVEEGPGLSAKQAVPPQYWEKLSPTQQEALEKTLPHFVKSAKDNCETCQLVVGIMGMFALEKGKPGRKSFKNYCKNEVPVELRGYCDMVYLAYRAAYELQKLGMSPLTSCKVSLQCSAVYNKCKAWKKWPPPGYPKRPPRPADDLFEAFASEAEMEQHLEQHDVQDEVARRLLDSVLERILAEDAAAESAGEDAVLSEGIADVFSDAEQVSRPSFEEDMKQLAFLLHGGDGKDANAERVFEDHLPLIDEDGDDFGPFRTFRGSDWSGHDCNDKDPAVYPGSRKQRHAIGGVTVDHNCNGIFGVNPRTGNDFQSELCADTPHMGVAILSDSAGAHFAIPEKWLNPKKFALHDEDGKHYSFNNLVHTLQNEFDWPQCSLVTGTVPPEQANDDMLCPPNKRPVESIYQRMLKRNRCIRGDYHNWSVNGAKSTAWIPGVGAFRSFRRRRDDEPLLMFTAFVGNDVCNARSVHAKDPKSTMTSEADFEARLREGLAHLDATLPPGSKVVVLPLAEGTVLYDSMAEEMHPLGMKYKDFYDFLNCMHDNPCSGWLTSKAKVRQATQEHADALSAVAVRVVEALAPRMLNIDVFAVRPGWVQRAFDLYDGPHSDLVDPIDGFHPSNTGLSLIADVVWADVVRWGLLPPENPHNDAIVQLFGDSTTAY
ncbi:MAG: hypothetical protein MHM6MM_005208 [Cercozoa sp. M6MM]